MARKPVVAGVAEHNGWAVLVCVSAVDGSFEVIDRRRVELLAAGLPNQPYEHETIGMSPADAERLVQEVRESAAVCAERALVRLRSDLGAGRELAAIAMRTGSLPRLPDTVAEVHASYHVTNRADGMVYHEALRTSAEALGIAVATFPKGKERGLAAETMGWTVQRVDQFLSGLRESLGAPWQQDHQTATARAIAALGQYAAMGTVHSGRRAIAGSIRTARRAGR